MYRSQDNRDIIEDKGILFSLSQTHTHIIKILVR